MRRTGDEPDMTMNSQNDSPDSKMQPEALDALRRAAQAGDGRASCRLGDHYRTGDAVGQDWDEVFRWYSLGAAQGDAEAQSNLGTMFLRGLGCEKDESQAVVWYRKSAEQGNPTGQVNLAERYLRGEGVAPDLAAAFEWFSAAAGQGDMESTSQVGTMYRFGRGVERNLVAAADLHVAAARGGNLAARAALAEYLDALQDIALSGDQIASRCLSEIHLLGLVGEPSQALTWTWIKWAKERCTPSFDADQAAFIDEAYEFYRQGMMEEHLKEGERILESLLKPLPRTLPVKKRQPAGGVAQKRRGPGNKKAPA
jgi:hypothetical protein